MLPKISVIIPFYNCPYVAFALESVLSQTYPNMEVVLVDDGSTAHTDKIAPYLGRIHYLGKQNGGTVSAVNYGFQMSTGEYVVWLSSDDLFQPGKLLKQMTFMLTHQHAVSYSNSYMIDDQGQFIPNAWPSLHSQADLCRAFMHSNPINGCSVIMRRDVLHRVGWLDPNLPYTHDMDLWIRILLAGYELAYLDEYLNVYRAHANTVTKRKQEQLEAEFRALLQRYHHPLGERAAQLDNR